MDDDLHPWVPAGARTFLVGDHVRIALSPECRCWTHEQHGLRRADLNGAVGRVTAPPDVRRSKFPDHDVFVAFDEPLLVREIYLCMGGAFLAAELELVTND